MKGTDDTHQAAPRAGKVPSSHQGQKAGKTVAVAAGETLGRAIIQVKTIETNVAIKHVS